MVGIPRGAATLGGCPHGIRPTRPSPDRSSIQNEVWVPVANIKSQIKRNRQNEKRRIRNRAVRSELRTRVKTALTAAETGTDADVAAAAAMKQIDKAGNKGVIHANTAARRKSRLQKRLNASAG